MQVLTGAAHCRAEARGGGDMARKSVMKRASLMGIRAGLTFSNLAQQARRHSGDAYVASHRALSGVHLTLFLTQQVQNCVLNRDERDTNQHQKASI